MGTPTIRHVRAFTVRGGGADYHDQGKDHWIDDHIATPMARYPEYRQSRQDCYDGDDDQQLNQCEPAAAVRAGVLLCVDSSVEPCFGSHGLGNGGGFLHM